MQTPCLLKLIASCQIFYLKKYHVGIRKEPSLRGTPEYAAIHVENRRIRFCRAYNTPSARLGVLIG